MQAAPSISTASSSVSREASAPSPSPSSESRPVGAAVPAKLDDLLDLDIRALERFYAAASTPKIEDVRGDLVGRMLAISSIPNRLQDAARAFARSSIFPWRGKSFRPLGEDHGEGKNRVVSDRFKIYRFETRIGQSLGGPFDALILNYDLPENPFFIRAIQDEIRELAPGLYLGQAYVKAGGPHRLWLYFGLTTREARFAANAARS